MSPKPYESLDMTAKSSTKGNCIILNIREGHSIGPYAYQLTSYRLTPDKAERSRRHARHRIGRSRKQTRKKPAMTNRPIRIHVAAHA